MHRTFAFLAAVALTTLSVASSCFAAAPGSLQFSLEPTRSDGRVQLSMRDRQNGRNNHWSSSFAASELRGLNPNWQSAAAPLSFALVRDAGRFDCSGTGARSSARGDCRFTPDPGFAAFLAGRGIGQPGREQAYNLALSGVGRAHVEALAANHYPKPTIDQLVAMGIHGASPRFIQDLAAAGYRLKSADDLVTFRIHGVSADYIRAIGAAEPQLRDLSGDDLVAFRIHGVSPELLRTYARFGSGRLERDEVVAMAIHGVTPAFIEQLAGLGYRGLPAGDLVQLRIFGVTPEFIRSVERDGAARVPVSELVQMRILGRRQAR